MRPYFARIFTKMSPYEELVTLPQNTELAQNLLHFLRNLLNHLGFWNLKFECYLAPRKCTIKENIMLKLVSSGMGTTDAGGPI